MALSESASFSDRALVLKKLNCLHCDFNFALNGEGTFAKDIVTAVVMRWERWKEAAAEWTIKVGDLSPYESIRGEGSSSRQPI